MNQIYGLARVTYKTLNARTDNKHRDKEETGALARAYLYAGIAPRVLGAGGGTALILVADTRSRAMTDERGNTCSEGRLKAVE